MIYVSEDKFHRQIELLRLASELTSATTVVAWLYPEAKKLDFRSLSIARESDHLLSVTTYPDDEEKPLHTKPVTFSTTLLAEFLASESRLVPNCDNIAIYRPKEDDWVACSIFHEKVCLVTTDNLLPALIQNGFSATERPPSWW